MTHITAIGASNLWRARSVATGQDRLAINTDDHNSTAWGSQLQSPGSVLCSKRSHLVACSRRSTWRVKRAECATPIRGDACPARHRIAHRLGGASAFGLHSYSQHRRSPLLGPMDAPRAPAGVDARLQLPLDYAVYAAVHRRSLCAGAGPAVTGESGNMRCTYVHAAALHTSSAASMLAPCAPMKTIPYFPELHKPHEFTVALIGVACRFWILWEEDGHRRSVASRAAVICQPSKLAAACRHSMVHRRRLELRSIVTSSSCLSASKEHSMFQLQRIQCMHVGGTALRPWLQLLS